MEINMVVNVVKARNHNVFHLRAYYAGQEVSHKNNTMEQKRPS